LRAVASEMRGWHTRAASIPDAALRVDALRALKSKRASADGAALFWTLPAGRCPNLLRLLVAFEVIADFLDNVSERGVQAGPANGIQLHLALGEALDPGGPVSAYYCHHPWREDGGYLRALVGACRERCVRLPHYRHVRSPAIHAATRARMLGLNHEPDPQLRDTALREWALREARSWEELAWFECTAAASGWLTVLALLALAAGRGEPEEDRVRAICAAYLPWISLVATMLDSYADQADDVAGAQHSYIAHYPCAEVAVERVCEIVGESARRARALPDAARHTVIVGCMVAMYLSKDSSRSPRLRASTRSLAAAGGPLPRLLLPVLRIWRVLYSQRDE
jgi:tetraprenyl-beta-curcumene synthase